MAKSFKIFVLALLIVGATYSAGHAQDYVQVEQELAHCGICEDAESIKYGRSWWGKIERGFVNIGFGWTNLFSQPIKYVADDDNILKGIGKGVGYTFLRTVQGVVEVVIFWLPPVHDEPLKNCAFGDLGWTGR